MALYDTPRPLKALIGLDYQVGVIGAGPTGLLVAAELATAGVSVVVLDRYESPDTTIKAGSHQCRDGRDPGPARAPPGREGGPAAVRRGARGVRRGERHVAAADGRPAGGRQPFPSTGHFAGLFFRPDLVDQTDPEIAAHAGSAGSTMVNQSEMEALLLAHLAALGVEVERGVEVMGMDPLLDEQGLEVGKRLSTSPGPLRVGWVVGADGGRSSIRQLAGIDFVGTDAEITGYQAIADLDGTDGLGRCDLSNYMAHFIRIKWPKSSVNRRLSRPKTRHPPFARWTRRPPFARLAR